MKCRWILRIVLFGVAITTNAQKLLREPYLQTAFKDSITVSWKTNLSIKKAYVLYTKEGSSKSVKSKLGNLLEHENNTIVNVVIKNLEPNTKYFYETYVDDVKLAGGDKYYFKSAPKLKNTKSFSFYALGDIGAKLPHSFASTTANTINNLSERPDFGLGLGDIIYPKGESVVYDRQLFKPFKELFKNIPFYPVLGNHDWRSNPDENFKKEWKLPNNEHFFSFEYANALFIGLDSRDGNFYNENNQIEWLKKELIKAKGKYDWIVVYLHHNGKTCTYKPDYTHVTSLYRVFANYGVDLVLNGHAHTYERLKPYNQYGEVVFNNGVKNYKKTKNSFISVTIGAGGKINKKWKSNPSDIKNCKDGSIVAHHEHVGCFSTVKINGEKLIMRGINAFTGEVFDEFTIQK